MSVTNDMVGGSFSNDPNTITLAGIGLLSSVANSSEVLSGAVRNPFQILASVTAISGSPLAVQGCYAVTYTFTGSGTPFGPGSEMKSLRMPTVLIVGAMG